MLSSFFSCISVPNVKGELSTNLTLVNIMIILHQEYFAGEFCERILQAPDNFGPQQFHHFNFSVNITMLFFSSINNLYKN